MARIPDEIPEPTVLLTGCQAWSRESGRPCPACKQGIRPENPTYHCLRCSGSAPQIEARVRNARLGLKARDRAKAARDAARDKLRRTRRRQPVLSESLRREIWNGYRGGLLAEFPDLTNAAKEGRDFLTAINQEPNWSLVPVLNELGKITGWRSPAREAS